MNPPNISSRNFKKKIRSSLVLGRLDTIMKTRDGWRHWSTLSVPKHFKNDQNSSLSL